MSSQDEWEQPYTARIPFPDYLERGRTQLVRLEVYRDGALVAPTSGTFSLYDASHVAQIDAAAVTIASSRAQYSINAASLPASLPVGEGWQEEWALTFSDGVTRTFRRSAALVLRAVHPVITDADLLACYSDLDDLRPSDLSSYQGPIDEAWRQIIGRLVGRGRFPYLSFDYDTDHDGKSDGKGKRTSYEPVIYLSNAPRGRWGGR
jgi:hypothetical protein